MNAIGIKHAKKSPKSKAPKIPESCLFVSVIQNGCEQIQACLPIGRFLPKVVSFGRLSSNLLCIPFAALPDAVKLFSVRGGRVSVFLDPRMEGYVNNTVRFAAVNEFLSPRGALVSVSSVLQPYELNLPYGSRGVIKFGHLEIIFKIDRKPPKFQLSPLLKGAGRAPLALPQSTDAMEKLVPLVSVALIGVLGFSLLLWLTKAPMPLRSRFEDLPFIYAREFIHPNHYRVLPFVFRDRLDTESPTSIAIEWVRALQSRWAAARAGRHHKSHLPLLRDFPVLELNPPDSALAERRARNSYAQFYQARNLAPNDPYLQILGAFPRVVSDTAGEVRGSFFIQMVQNIRMVNSTLVSISSQMAAEQEFLRDKFVSLGMKFEPFGLPKSPDGTEIASPQFNLDKARRQLVVGFAADAARTQLRKKLLSYTQDDQGVLWLSDDGVVTPKFLQNKLRIMENSFEQIQENAEYASGLKPVPLPPPPVPSIDMMDVDLVVYGKREELRACYESALRRNNQFEGIVEWQLHVSTLGKLVDLRINKTDLQDKEFLYCLQERIKSWSFPRAKNGTMVFYYPFRFKRAAR